MELGTPSAVSPLEAVVAAAAANDARACMREIASGRCTGSGDLHAGLRAAVDRGGLAAAELLLNCGAPVEEEGTRLGPAGQTVLHRAVRNSEPEMLRLLLGRGGGCCLGQQASEDGGQQPLLETPLELGRRLAELAPDQAGGASECFALLQAASEREAGRAVEQRDAEASRGLARAEGLLARGKIGEAAAVLEVIAAAPAPPEPRTNRPEGHNYNCTEEASARLAEVLAIQAELGPTSTGEQVANFELQMRLKAKALEVQAAMSSKLSEAKAAYQGAGQQVPRAPKVVQQELRL